ncbi:MAG: RNA polymerase ECF-type sigma factor [uncultured Frankineae bacterium]|uniref:RNA polymerase ECF-type sigma factor n=1 Tax=uncultured Frankineae bacterium TaxID=437475 RepID=A0A6J4LH80_9ACTN|nr:MAG: RNA polymerase ECF-type sigma factor [uncultured Frankineae bacterium]
MEQPGEPDVDDPGLAADREDRALLAAHLAGDPDAFGRLVARAQGRLWAVALRTLGDREEAADALQDALLSAYRAAGSYRGDARVTTWLHRIVVNACLDRLRRRRVRSTVPLDARDAEHADPRDLLGERETALVLEAALAALPDDQRLAILLVDVQGLPVADAAHVLGVAVGTVKSRCSRGRARLAVALGHLRNRAEPSTVPPGTTAVPPPSPHDRDPGGVP